MKATRVSLGINRRALLTATAALPILFAPLLPVLPPAQAQSDALPSWNDGASKRAITGFVARITQQGGPDFVPPAERIATFDNDGTLWVEHPMYVQLAFALDRVKAMAPMHLEWQHTQPFQAVLEGDMKALAAAGEHGMAELVMATHAGMTADEFQNIVMQWLAAARDPRFKRPYTELSYQPMIELLAYLRANGFKTFIVSGGGVEFMRPWTERVYGVPPEQVVGSSIKTRFQMRDGRPELFRLPEVNFIDDGAGKPVNSSAAARSPPSAIPTAICKCCNGRPWAAVRALGSLSITPTLCANTPTTATHPSAVWTRHWTPRRSTTGSWPT